MTRFPKTIFSLAGIMAGIIIVHPYVMLVHQITGPGHGTGDSGKQAAINLFAAFSPSMLPMTVAFGFFGAVCGVLLGLLFERNQRILRYQYQARMHRDLMNSLQQLLGVISHYILNSSMVISGHAGRLIKKADDRDRQSLAAIAQQARKNEAILKVIQEADFLENIDPSDNTYQKLVDLNRTVEKHFT